MSICATPRFCCWCAESLSCQADIVGDGSRLFRIDCSACGLSTYGSLDDGERAACIAPRANVLDDMLASLEAKPHSSVDAPIPASFMEALSDAFAEHGIELLQVGVEAGRDGGGA